MFCLIRHCENENIWANQPDTVSRSQMTGGFFTLALFKACLGLTNWSQTDQLWTDSLPVCARKDSYAANSADACKVEAAKWWPWHHPDSLPPAEVRQGCGVFLKTANCARVNVSLLHLSAVNTDSGWASCGFVNERSNSTSLIFSSSCPGVII